MTTKDIWISLLLAMFISAVIIGFENGLIFFDSRVNFTFFTAIPLLGIAIFQLYNTVRLNKATFVKDYISKIFLDERLSDAFYFLSTFLMQTLKKYQTQKMFDRKYQY